MTYAPPRPRHLDRRAAHRDIFVGGNSTAAQSGDDSAPRPEVEGFRSSVQQAGASTGDGKGMWADSTFEDLIQYNDGCKTGLIGTDDQIAERIVAFKTQGVNLLLTAYLW